MSKVCAVAVKQLIEQELALDSYLATMLAELPSTEAIEEQERQVKKVVSSAVKVQAATVKMQEPSIELVLMWLRRARHYLLCLNMLKMSSLLYFLKSGIWF